LWRKLKAIIKVITLPFLPAIIIYHFATNRPDDIVGGVMGALGLLLIELFVFGVKPDYH
jgi:hypothetical protein